MNNGINPTDQYNNDDGNGPSSNDNDDGDDDDADIMTMVAMMMMVAMMTMMMTKIGMRRSSAPRPIPGEKVSMTPQTLWLHTRIHNENTKTQIHKTNQLQARIHNRYWNHIAKTQ